MSLPSLSGDLFWLNPGSAIVDIALQHGQVCVDRGPSDGHYQTYQIPHFLQQTYLEQLRQDTLERRDCASHEAICKQRREVDNVKYCRYMPALWCFTCPVLKRTTCLLVRKELL